MTSLPQISPQLREKLSRVRGLILDVDGVLTTGAIIYDHLGNEVKIFHIHDGMGIVSIQKIGLVTAIISGRASQAVQKRADELNIQHVYEQVADKTVALDELCTATGLLECEFAHIGDDLADLGLFKRVGFAVAVSNAVQVVQDRANYVTRLAGGQGAVREVCDLLLSAHQQ